MSEFLGWCCYNLQKRITLKFPLTNVHLQTTTIVGTKAQKIYEIFVFLVDCFHFAVTAVALTKRPQDGAVYQQPVCAVYGFILSCKCSRDVGQTPLFI